MGVVVEATNNAERWLATILVEPNVRSVARQYKLFGNNETITVENTDTQKWKFINLIKPSRTGQYTQHDPLFSATKLCALMKFNGKIYVYYGTTPTASTGYYSTNNYATVSMTMYADFYIIPRSEERKCATYINNGLPPIQNTRNVVAVNLSAREIQVTRSQPNENILISKASLWKEMQYNRDILSLIHI